MAQRTDKRSDRDQRGGRKRAQAGPIKRKSCFFCKEKIDDINYKNASGNLLVLVVFVPYFYVSSVVFLVGAQLDDSCGRRALCASSGSRSGRRVADTEEQGPAPG